MDSAFHRHIANMLTDLRKLGMGSHQVAFILWEGDVRVIDWLEEVECIWVAFKRMERKVVACVDAISKVFESSRGGRNKVWANSADFRDSEYTVVSSLQRASKWVVVETFKSEQPRDTSWMENFDSVWWHLVSDEIERQVDIRKEELHREESIEELAWCVVFNHFHPNLLLLAVSALNKVI